MDVKASLFDPRAYKGPPFLRPLGDRAFLYQEARLHSPEIFDENIQRTGH